MEATLNAVLILVGYLLGSVPFAYLTVRVVSGQDIRKTGSGNVGALNVYQNAGLAAGIGVLAADAAKGALAVLVPVWFGAPDWVSYASAAAAVAGHNWPVFLRFRGGKGAATILGIGLALAPFLALISLAPILVALVAIRNMVVGVFARLSHVQRAGHRHRTALGPGRCVHCAHADGRGGLSGQDPGTDDPGPAAASMEEPGVARMRAL